MELILKIKVERAEHETRNLPDPHSVAEALIEHLTRPSDPEDLIFTVSRRAGAPLELQIADIDLVNVDVREET